MKKVTLPAFLISLVTLGCMHREPSLKMLEERADYDAFSPAAKPLNLQEGAIAGEGAKVSRSGPKIIHVWIHEHETPDSAYFGGGWITVSMDESGWRFMAPPNAAGAEMRRGPLK